jgi:hypothetical protein
MSSLVAASGPLRGASAPPRPGAREAGLPHAPAITRAIAAGPALAIAACAALALIVAGCGGQAAVALPGKTTVPAVPAAVAGQQAPTARGQVVAAYTGYWQALGQALDARNATQARAILAPFASSALIPSLVSGLETDWARGEIQYGAPVPHILSVQITGNRAAVHDCADFSHAGVQMAATGQVVGSLGNPRVNMISVLLLSGSRWLLSNQVPVVAPCSP